MMNDADNTQGQGLTTEQIASARPAPTREDVPAAAEDDFRGDDWQPMTTGYDDDNAARLAAGLPASENADRGVQDVGNGGAPDTGNVAADPGARVSLLEDGEQQSITMRWKDIQAEFVDEPTKAIEEADALVAELMQRLASMFASERAELEERWAGGSQVSTEDLRQSLRHYRSFFERLLAA